MYAYRIMTATARRSLSAPTGWLINPEKKLVLFFIRDPKSLMRLPNVITQLWHSTEEGIPTQLKNTRKLDLASAIETWNELLNNGWSLVDYEINKDAA